MTDLEIAFAALSAKQQTYDELWAYYDGNHPLTYSVARLREVFKSAQTRFTENWCAVVVDAVLERLMLQGFAVAGDEQAGERLAQWWTEAEIGLDADDAHLAALVTGESFIIVWPDEDGVVQAYYNDPRWCCAIYDTENRKTLRLAAKWWITATQTYRLNLYYPDRIEYYETPPLKNAPTGVGKFVPREDPAENPYGQIPVFHLRPERRAIISALDDVIPLQAAINKLLSDMMVSAEFGAFRQRWIISNADTTTLKNSPNEIWTIPAGDGLGQGASVGEFGETRLKNFLEAIDDMVHAISAITRTPAHYFFTQGGTPSGEALVALEAPLNKKTDRYIGRFTSTWQQIGAFALRLLTGAEIAPGAITAIFAAPETVQPKTTAEIRQINVGAGVPLTTTLRMEGWSEAEIAQMEREKIAEQAAQQQSLAMALVEQQRRFDQGAE